MNAKFAISFQKVWKKYSLQHEKPTLVESLFVGKKVENYEAVSNISLQVESGEKVGIIGANGSGKTTLLKLIAGIVRQSEGRIRVSGRVVALIDLEAGFHPDLTGEENVYLNGVLLGMTRNEIRGKMAEIMKFADIGRFSDAPLYTYSQGMLLRLGFSIAVATDPDILVLDEVIEVGDENFRKKSNAKMQEFFKLGKTVVVVSHNMKFIEDNCDRVVWMERAKVKKDGEAFDVIKSYMSES